MTKIRALFVVAFMAITSLASAQDPMTSTMKKGDKAWTDLENTLREADLQWLCQGKYWADQFFEINPGTATQTKAEMYAVQTEGAKTYTDVVRGEGPNPTEFKLMAVYGNIAMAVDHTSFKV